MTLPSLPAGEVHAGVRARPSSRSSRLNTWWATHRPGPLAIRWRLTLYYTTVLAVTLIALSLVVYYFMGASLIRDMDRSSQERAKQVEDILHRKVLESQVLNAADAFLLSKIGVLSDSVDPFQNPGVGVRVYDARGSLATGSDTLIMDRHRIPDDRVFVTEAIRGRVHRDVLPTAEGPFYAYSQPVFLANGQLYAVVQILTSMQSYRSTMDLLARLLIWGTLLATALAFFTGAALAQTALAPIDGATRTAQQIILTQDLSRRVPAGGPPDEIGRLVSTLNDMLERIQEMFERQRRFLADVSHELRTPLTTIRGELDFLGRAGRLDPEALEAATSEAERMSRLVGDLLLLARDDDGVSIDRSPVELDSLLLDVFRQARRLAGEARSVVLAHEDTATIVGDADRLKQLLLNLVDNALKYTPPGAQVTLALYRDATQARLIVADDGPGIPPEDLPHIFDRFYRVDKARARGSGGTGLGLAIVRWIASAHGGDVEVQSGPEAGTRFTVWLPLSTELASRAPATRDTLAGAV